MEYAQNVAGIVDAAHPASDPDAYATVLAPMACSLTGERRTVNTVPGTRAAAICGEAPMSGYHSCTFGLDHRWIPKLAVAGLVLSGYADDGTVEIVELPSHPFFVATLFQPLMGVTGDPASEDLHPLFTAFVHAVHQHARERGSAPGTPGP